MHRSNWTHASNLSRISSEVTGREEEATLIAASTRIEAEVPGNTTDTLTAGVSAEEDIPRTAREARI